MTIDPSTGLSGRFLTFWRGRGRRERILLGAAASV